MKKACVEIKWIKEKKVEKAFFFLLVTKNDKKHTIR